MSASLTITKAALASLFDLPAPDDSGPWGPVGPVIRNGWWVMLNPQPLPPDPPPDPWRVIRGRTMGFWPVSPRSRFGPLPDLWRTAFLARSVIEASVEMGRSAETAASEEQAAAILSSTRMSIQDFVDDICGNERPARWPRPWQWPLRTVEPSNPVDLLIAGAQFQKVADGFENPLAGDFGRAADTLFQTGLNRLAETEEQAGSAQSAASAT
jgi:hypothetical protein